MRTISLLFVAVLLFAAGCTESDRSDRIRERAEDRLSEARENLQEAREHLDEARESLRDDMRDAAEDAAEDVAEQTDILTGLGEVFEDLGRKIQDRERTEPVDFRKLRDLLPRDAAGMERVSTDGERSGAIGIRVAHVQGKYRGRDRTMEIDIVDLGTLSAIAGAKDWFDVEVDRESDDGVERTTRIDGHPAHVETHQRSASAVIMVQNRFVVKIEIEGRGADLDMLEDVVDEIGLNRLERLAS